MTDSETLDYRDMLVRYIRHVGMEEGSDFLENRHGVCSDVRWTDKEWLAMRYLRLAALADKDFTTHSPSDDASDSDYSEPNA